MENFTKSPLSVVSCLTDNPTPLQVLSHPLYDQAGYNGDLALLKLDREVAFRYC